MNRLFIRRPSRDAYNIGYGSSDEIVTGTDGWANYTWNKTKGVITFTKDSKSYTVKQGSSNYTDITTKVKDWTPVASSQPSSTSVQPSTSTTESDTDKKSGGWFEDTIGSFITGWMPQPDIPVSTTNTESVAKKGMPSWVLPAAGAGAVVLILIVVLASKNKKKDNPYGFLF